MTCFVQKSTLVLLNSVDLYKIYVCLFTKNCLRDVAVLHAGEVTQQQRCYCDVGK